MTRAALRLGAALIAACALAGAPASAADGAAIPTFEGAVQGGLIRGQLPAGSKLSLDGVTVQVSEDGYFVMGFGREAKPAWSVAIEKPDGTAETREIEIGQRTYDVQSIEGLPPKTVEPPAEDMPRIEREWLLKQAAKKKDTKETWFMSDFAWPLTGRISGVYGSQRIRNGKPGKPHYGLDIAAPEGTPITAPAPGRVTLAESDLYFEGGTVFIDHGHGLLSIMMHMSRVDAVAGQEVKAGDIIGAVGMTGRSTGPHLHWGMIWLDRQIDPQLLLPPQPAPKADPADPPPPVDPAPPVGQAP